MANFSLSRLAIMKSNFSRKPQIQYGEGEQTIMKLSTNSATESDMLVCILSVQISSTFADEQQFELDIEYQGEFKFKDASEKEMEDFANLNGPAIIFPFLREHISSLSLKGDLKNILLPPVNFVQLAEDRKKKDE